MIKLSHIFHHHNWSEGIRGNGQLPKKNCESIYMSGIMQECKCGAKRFIPDGIHKSVEVKE